MDLEQAKEVFLRLNDKAYLDEYEQSQFDRAADILEDNCMLDENGELIDEDKD